MPAPISVSLRHVTRYTYDHAVLLGPHIIRLRPAPHNRTPIHDYTMTVGPTPQTFTRFRDPAANEITRVSFERPVAELTVTVSLTATLVDNNPFDFFVEPETATWPFTYPELLRQELTPCLAPAGTLPDVAALAAGVRAEGTPSVEILTALNHSIFNRLAYTVRNEPGVQSSAETLDLLSGSCRDSAWLLVEAARSLGFAARFASGYLIQLAGPDQAPGAGQDQADLHAWAEVFLPGAGWIGFDATSGLMTGSGHIPLSCNATPEAAAPVTGTVQAGTSRFDVTMSVTRLPSDTTASAISPD